MQSRLNKLGLLGSACLIASSLVTTHARADEHLATAPRSGGAHGAGIALTATGLSFIATGFIGGAIMLGMMATSQTGDGPTTGGLAIAGGIFGGCTIIGVSTLIPGAILMNKRADDIVRDAHAAPPLPRFTSVPILGGTF